VPEAAKAKKRPHEFEVSNFRFWPTPARSLLHFEALTGRGGPWVGPGVSPETACGQQFQPCKSVSVIGSKLAIVDSR
jgi:hypothetical protein